MRGRMAPIWTISQRFLSPPDRSTLSARDRKLSSKPTLRASAATSAGTSAGSRPMAAKASLSASDQGDPRYFYGVLQGQKKPGLGTLPRWHAQQVDAVEADRARRHLVAGPARDHVGKRGFPRAVRAHHGMDLPAADAQVDPSQDFLAPHPDVQTLYDELAHSTVTTTSSPSTRTGYTSTARVAGRHCGLPSFNENVLPCLVHSTVPENASTSPSESGQF